MTLVGWIQIFVFSLLIAALIKPLGIYMYRVFEGEEQPLPRLIGPAERFAWLADFSAALPWRVAAAFLPRLLAAVWALASLRFLVAAAFLAAALRSALVWAMWPPGSDLWVTTALPARSRFHSERPG